MLHKKTPAAPASANGPNQKLNNQNLAKNNYFHKPILSEEIVNNLRKETLKEQFFVSDARINWLVENAFGEFANDR